jgi:class 3 adenylate cyclase/tetratricopeptide (TPR) repeat protein
VLFADIKGSMELLAHRDPEEARKLLDPLLELMMDAVHRYEGTVNQVMGDGIMALFGAPVAQEDHAIRACCAALQIQESARRYSAELQRGHGTPVEVRVGLNAGEVVVRSIESDLHADYTAVGQVTHLAARMEQLATPGTVLMTADVVRLVGGAVDAKPRGLIAVKGLADAVDVFELVAVRSNLAGLAALSARDLTPFVGRRSELESLGARLEQARRGEGQVVAVVGEPGIGKSRLVWELVHSQWTAAWRVLAASGVSHGRRTVYLPVIALLKAYFGIQDHDDTRVIQDRVASRMLQLDPALEPIGPPLLALLEALSDESPFSRLQPTRRRREIVAAVKTLLLRESAEQPVLVVVEDLHWIDAASQAVLDALVESLPAARIVLLVTYRPEYQHGWAGTTYYAQLPIGPLTTRDAEEFLGALLGREPELRPLQRRIVEQSEGNPFFMEESVRALVEERTLVGVPEAYRLAKPVQRVSVPATVQAVLAARIDRLPPEDKQLLQAAAVVGKDVPGALVEAIVDQPAERVRQGFADLRAGGFMYESGLFPEVRYTFKHALTQEVAYGSLLRERRRALHVRIIRAVEQIYPDRLSDHVERLAHHAIQGELWDTALRYLRQAGARAFAHSAHKVAAGWFEQALGVLEHLPGAASGEQAIDLRLELRYALMPLGQLNRMHDVLRQAEDLARALDDRRRLGVVSSFLTNYFQFMGDLERAVEYGERALEIATSIGDLAVEVVATAYLSLSYQTLGQLPRAIELARRNVARLPGDLALEWFGMAILPAIYSRTGLVRALAEVGEFADGEAIGQEGVRIGEQVDHAYSLHFACLGLGVLYLRRGDWARAIGLLERAHELCRVADAPAMLAHVAGFLAAAYTQAGRSDDAIALLESAQEHAASLGLPGSTLGHAVRLAALGEAYLVSGHPARATELGRVALECFERLRARGYEAWALHLLGAAHAATPATHDAETLFERALALAQELGMRPLLGQCLLDLGVMQARAGRPRSARAALAQAQEVFRSMEAPYWRARVERAMDDVG